MTTHLLLMKLSGNNVQSSRSLLVGINVGKNILVAPVGHLWGVNLVVEEANKLR